MQEEWKDIEGFEGTYQISDNGRVRSFCGGKPHIMKQKTHKGYALVGLSKNGKQYLKQVHRLVALAFIDNPENKREVNHKDADKTNNTALNLEWVTPMENTIHAMQLGLRKNCGGKTGVNYCVPILIVNEKTSKESRYKSQLEASIKTGISRSTLQNYIGKSYEGQKIIKAMP
jgi:hypothetical protein